MKQRILFVDIESNVLHGLRRMLRAERDGEELNSVCDANEPVARSGNSLVVAASVAMVK